MPELIARQSSWFWTFAPEIVIEVLDPTSKPSVFAAKEPASPAELSIVISLRVRPVELSIEKTWTGVLRMLRPLIDEVPVRSWA